MDELTSVVSSGLSRHQRSGPKAAEEPLQGGLAVCGWQQRQGGGSGRLEESERDGSDEHGEGGQSGPAGRPEGGPRSRGRQRGAAAGHREGGDGEQRRQHHPVLHPPSV